MAVFEQVYRQLKSGKNKKDSTIQLRIKGDLLGVSKYVIKKDVPEADFIAAAASMAWDDGLSHEAWTAQKGFFKFEGIPGFWNSAFSPEDLTSDIVGPISQQSFFLMAVKSTTSRQV